MHLRSIRGGSQEELENREYNIGIGISLGNKWFTGEHIHGLVEWALARTKEFVVVYVADGIHAINIEVRSDKNPEKALRRALKLGDKKLAEAQAALVDLPVELKKRIYYGRWSDFQTERFREKVHFLYQKYEEDSAFRKTIIGIVRDFISDESRAFTDEEVAKLGTYIIEELPEIIDCAPMGDLPFEADAYPFDGAIAQLAEDIQLGKRFPEIRDAIMDTAPRVFLEVR